MNKISEIQDETVLENDQTILNFDNIPHELKVVNQVTMQQTVTYPVNSVLSKDKLLCFGAVGDSQHTLVSSYDINGINIAQEKIPFPAIERVKKVDGVIMAVQKLDKGIGVLAVDDKLTVKNYYSFLNTDIFFGPFPISYQNSPALFWTEGDQKIHVNSSVDHD